MRTKIIFTCILFLLINSALLSATKDNKQLLDELKKSSMKVIEKNLALIEKNKNGKRTDKRISPKSFGMDAYKQFKMLISKESWKVRDLTGSNNEEQLARALTLYLAAARIVIAKNQKKINTDANGKPNPKHFYPAVFGRLTADEFYKSTKIKIKQTTTGNGMGARNSKYNTPDSWENKALKKLESASWNRKKGVGEKVTENSKKYYRYIMPLEIKKACLSCHGDPKGSKDISGHIREGYKINDIRGGISVKIPVK